MVLCRTLWRENVYRRHVAHSSKRPPRMGPCNKVIYCVGRRLGFERSSVSCIHDTDPEVKAYAKDLITKAKAKAEDLSLKAKAKDTRYCPRGASRPRTWPRGLQHWRLLVSRGAGSDIEFLTGNCNRIMADLCTWLGSKAKTTNFCSELELYVYSSRKSPSVQ